MTESNGQPGTWKPIPGFGYYEASDRGLIRSVDRVIGGAQRFGVTLKTRPNNRGYLIVGLTDDSGKRQTRTVHSLVLETFEGPCPPGMEACHGPRNGSGPSIRTDNRWPENLRWDTPAANDEEWRRDNPPAPKPAKACVRCGDDFTGNGRRCHRCVVAIGTEAAAMLRDGVGLEAAAERLGYPSVSGLHTLAVKYGGYGQSRSRRVRKWLGARVAGGDSS